MLKPALTAAAFLSLLLSARAEGAEPFRHTSGGRQVSEFVMMGHGVQAVEHRRQPGEVAASFQLEPGPVPAETEAVFQVVSVRGETQKLRWRCIAKADIRECFQVPALFSFLPGDELLRLEVRFLEPGAELSDSLELALGR